MTLCVPVSFAKNEVSYAQRRVDSDITIAKMLLVREKIKIQRNGGGVAVPLMLGRTS